MQSTRRGIAKGHLPTARKVAPFIARFFVGVVACALAGAMGGCATPGVTQGTGRVLDPPLELILFCLLNPAHPGCRGVMR